MSEMDKSAMTPSINFLSPHCLKALLILFNLLFWIAGLSLTWIGIYLKTDFQNYLKISTHYSLRASYLLLTVGAIILFVTSLACSCIIRKKSVMLTVYGGFLITMLFTLISSSIYIYAFKDQLILGISGGMTENIALYGKNATSRHENLINFLQENLQCCGNESYQDWDDKIPDSCCRKGQICSPNSVDGLHKVGCLYKLTRVVGTNLTTIGVTVSATALFPLFGAIIAFAYTLQPLRPDYETIF